MSFMGNRGGMSLVEVMVSMACASILAMFAGVTIIDSQKEYSNAQIAATVVDVQSNMKRWLASSSSGGQSCKSVYHFASAFDPASQTNIRIFDPSDKLHQTYLSAESGHNIVKGLMPVTISKLYMSNVSLSRSAGSGSDAKTTYVGTLWMEGVFQNKNAVVKKSVTALSFTVDSTGALVECNSSSAADSDQATNCSGLSGYVWNGTACANQLKTVQLGDVVTSNFFCHGENGLQLDTSDPSHLNCRPSPKACPADQQIAQTVKDGLVTNCGAISDGTVVTPPPPPSGPMGDCICGVFESQGSNTASPTPRNQIDYNVAIGTMTFNECLGYDEDVNNRYSWTPMWTRRTMGLPDNSDEGTFGQYSAGGRDLEGNQLPSAFESTCNWTAN